MIMRTFWLKALIVAVIGWCLVGSCNPKNQSASVDNPKFQQYYVQGELLYQQHCSNCHQADGSGLGKVYPPLNTSDFMEKNFDSVVCLIKYGYEGAIEVNGVEYNLAMPANALLTDLEVAEIITYIYNTWDHNRGLVEVLQVAPVLNKCNP